MNAKQRTWIETEDDRICRALEGNEDIDIEALMWCGHRQIKWDKDKLAKLVPLLEEYGKPAALIDAMRRLYKTWKLAPAPTPEEVRVANERDTIAQ